MEKNPIASFSSFARYIRAWSIYKLLLGKRKKDGVKTNNFVCVD